MYTTTLRYQSHWQEMPQVMSHTMPDGSERPIAFACTLSQMKRTMPRCPLTYIRNQEIPPIILLILILLALILIVGHRPQASLSNFRRKERNTTPSYSKHTMHEVPPEYTLQQLRSELTTMQRARNLAIWHDHSTILKTGYILFCV